MEHRIELKQLGKAIKTKRESLRLTQDEFATLCGLSKNYIGMLERGERNPSYLTLLQIVKKLNITINEIL
mgnify:CR=1 FL=1